MGDGARARRHPARATTAAMSASNICTSPTSRSAASCRTAWKAATRRSSSPPEGKKAILDKVIRGRAVGEIPRPQICRHQALRPRRRRIDDPGARKRDQIWRRSMGVREIVYRHGASRPAQRARQRHGQAVSRDLPRIRRRHRPIPRTSAARATSNITSAPPPTASSTASRSTCRWSPNPSHLEAVDPVVLGKVARASRPCATTSTSTSRCCRC